ncbi:hypothetical protein [Streptomyces sp. CB03911]|uniref:hypothetical protein n=1 Tax=Streptomyces sp. CB03911 TaxID=1804758 RepID=UPI00093EEEB1|nr:hypothetical protein [Streptomyces sp. CB03911]OKI16579.1 hypothetical protein A6A07_11260 [Streptomyces sp. CB03911]
MALVGIPENDSIEGGFHPTWTLEDELCDDTLHRYPWFVDRDSETWALVPWTWHGEAILVPFASNMRPATRASVEATYGPLTEEKHR